LTVSQGTGVIGSHLVQALLNGGGRHTITSLTRLDSTTPLPARVIPARVDYSDEESLVTALRGQQFLVVALAVSVPEGTNSRLIRAAARAGVAYVLPNYFGHDVANEALCRETLHPVRSLADIAEIETLGTSGWVAMVCGLWYEYSLAMGPAWFGFDFKQRKLTYFDDGETKINVTTWEQCGRALAALVSLKELPDDEDDKSPTVSMWRNKGLYVSSFLVSQRDMFESWKRVSGERDEDWTFEYEGSAERYQRGLAEMQKGSVMGGAIAMFARCWYPNGDGNYEDGHGLDNDVLGLPREDLDECTRVAKGMIEKGYAAERARGTVFEKEFN
jgi:hypothetical protein